MFDEPALCPGVYCSVKYVFLDKRTSGLCVPLQSPVLSIFGACPGMAATTVAGLDGDEEREDAIREVAKLRGIYSVEEGKIQDINVGDILC